jgi:hypothetical protein
MSENEYDPTGRDPHAPGAKLDAGKARWGLVVGGFALALGEVVQVGTYGANKYSDNGWETVPKAKDRYMDAALRHIVACMTEGDTDESGYHHLGHAAWNILAVLELDLRDKELGRDAPEH